uniref:PE-PGRS family protein n=1 Tax=Parastrongyloides trichosuri TaxID=131310 RepID=A0A0N4ZZN3_PARTI
MTAPSLRPVEIAVVLQRRHRLSRALNGAEVQGRGDDAGLVMVGLGDDLAPGADNGGTPPGLATVLVRPALGRGQDEGAGLDGAGAQQGLPVGLAGRAGEGGGHRDHRRPALGQGAIEVRETHIIADAEAQPPPGRFGHACRVAGTHRGALTIGLAARQIDDRPAASDWRRGCRRARQSARWPSRSAATRPIPGPGRAARGRRHRRPRSTGRRRERPGAVRGSWSPRASGSAWRRPPPPRGPRARHGPVPQPPSPASASESARCRAARPSGRQQGVETAARVQGVDVVGAAHMFVADEYLREGRLAVGAGDHLGLDLGITRGDDFGEFHALALQQAHGGGAIGATGLGVDDDFGQRRVSLTQISALLRRFARGSHPRDDGQVHGAGSGGQKDAGAGLGGGPGRQDIVDQKDAPALDAATPRLGDSEGLFHVQTPPARRLAALAVGRSAADQGVGQVVEPGVASQRARDFGGLIEAPRQQATAVQGHRDHGVGLGHHVGARPRDPAGEQGGELLLVAVLELEDQAARGLIVDASRAGPGEGVGLDLTGQAAVGGEVAAIILKRRAAAVADGGLQEHHPAPGVGRQARRGRGLAAVVGHGRQQQVQQTTRHPARAQRYMGRRVFQSGPPTPILNGHERPLLRSPDHLRRRPPRRAPEPRRPTFPRRRLPARSRRRQCGPQSGGDPARVSHARRPVAPSRRLRPRGGRQRSEGSRRRGPRRRAASADGSSRRRGWRRRRGPGRPVWRRCPALPAIHGSAHLPAFRRSQPCRPETPKDRPDACPRAAGRSGRGRRDRSGRRRRPGRSERRRRSCRLRPDVEQVLALDQHLEVALAHDLLEGAAGMLVRQHPVVRFHDDAEGVVHPVGGAGEQVFFEALDVDLGQEERAVVDAGDQFGNGDDGQARFGAFSADTPSGVGGDQGDKARLGADGGLGHRDGGEGLGVQTQHGGVGGVRLDRDDASLGEGLMEPARGGADIGPGVDDDRNLTSDQHLAIALLQPGLDGRDLQAVFLLAEDLTQGGDVAIAAPDVESAKARQVDNGGRRRIAGGYSLEGGTQAETSDVFEEGADTGHARSDSPRAHQSLVVGRRRGAVDGGDVGAEIDGEAVAVHGLVGLANSHDHTSPVSIFTGSSGFHQRAVGDRLGQLAGRGGRGCAIDGDADELGRALAVLDQLVGQIEHHPVQGGREVLQPAVADPADARRARGAGGEQQGRVIGRGVAVHGDAVEGGADVQVQQGLQHRRGDVGVGDDEGQHGGHVRRDHARALGDAGDLHLDAFDLTFRVRALGEGVRGHDAEAGLSPGVGLQARFDVGQAGGDLGLVQHHADDPGRGQHDVALTAVEALGHLGRRAACRVSPGLAGEGVGAAGVDDQGLDPLAAALVGVQLTFAPVHRGRAHLVAGEDAGAGRALGEAEDHQIVALVLVEARASRGDLDPADGRNGREGHGQRRDHQARLAGRSLGGRRLGGALQGRGQRVQRLFDGGFDHLAGRTGFGGRTVHEATVPAGEATTGEAGAGLGCAAGLAGLRKTSTEALPRSCSSN